MVPPRVVDMVPTVVVEIVPVLVVEIVPVLVVEMVPVLGRAVIDKLTIKAIEHGMYLKLFMTVSLAAKFGCLSIAHLNIKLFDWSFSSSVPTPWEPDRQFVTNG
jgi:hypothetical protein